MRRSDLIGDRYKIESTLNERGSTSRYIAKDVFSNTRVLLETFTQSLINDERTLESLKHEIETSSKLAGSYFMEYLDCVTHDGTVYIVWKYVDASPLTRNSALSSLQERDVCRIVARLIAGLSNAHSHGIIHGALSTDVILLTPALEPIITGFSTPGASLITDPGMFQGVSAYRAAAPELFKGVEIDRSCDFYSIGIIAKYLFENLSKTTVENKENPTMRRAREVITMLTSSERQIRLLAADRILDTSFLDDLATPAWGQDALVLSKKQVRKIKKNSRLNRKNSYIGRWYFATFLRFVAILAASLTILFFLYQIMDPH